MIFTAKLNVCSNSDVGVTNLRKGKWMGISLDNRQEEEEGEEITDGPKII